MPDLIKNKRKTRKSDSKKWWNQGFESVNAGSRLRILPFWEAHRTSGNRIDIVIDPGAAFGLGDHPTTIMALELLEVSMTKLLGELKPPEVLDVGSGVGILSIASVLMGAKCAIALDIDPIAVHVARRNCDVNKVGFDEALGSGVIHCLGGVECVMGRFDLVTANLVAPLLLRIRKEICANSSNLLLLSGIFESMFYEVIEAFGKEGFDQIEARSSGDWRSTLFARRR